MCPEKLPNSLFSTPGLLQGPRWLGKRETTPLSEPNRWGEPLEHKNAAIWAVPDYVRARELKAAGMDWTDVLAVEDENPRARLAAELLASKAYGSTAERIRAFMEQGGGCRATFFNYRRKIGGGKSARLQS